jgi:hypothetical protein
MTVLPTEKLLRILDEDELYFNTDFWHFKAIFFNLLKENKYYFLFLSIDSFSFSYFL